MCKPLLVIMTCNCLPFRQLSSVNLVVKFAAQTIVKRLIYLFKFILSFTVLSSLPTPINEPILLSLKGTNLYRDGGQYVCNVASTNGITLAGSGGGGDIIIQSVMTTFVFKIEQENTSFYISMVLHM